MHEKLRSAVVGGDRKHGAHDNACSACRRYAALPKTKYAPTVKPMTISPAPAQHAHSRRINTLRITPALSAMAAVMNGVDPDPADVAALAETTVSVQDLHLAAAAALRQAMGPLLLSRTTGAGAETSSELEKSTIFDAYYLATELAKRSDKPMRLTDEQVDSALLIGAMQVRLLEAVCSQIELNVVLPPLSVSAKAPARSVLKIGGDLAPGVQLLPDYSTGGGGNIEGSSWLHALSTITVAGVSGREVVDAGPDTASAQWAARLAAPVTVTATGGFWPVTVVEDCLRISADAVRRWVAAMPRELCGEEGRDIMLRSGPPLRDFLVSPATLALTGDTGRSEVLPLRAVEGSGKPLRGVLAEMRVGGVVGSELSPDVELPGGFYINEIHRDELAVLSAGAVTELPDEVEVTVNFDVPEWKDVAALVETVRETGAVTLTSSVVGWTERDIVAGQLNRVSLRARVRRGAVCHTQRGDAVLMPAGTTFTVVGVDTGKGHTALYGVQVDPVEVTGSSSAAAAEVA
jgi:hypothetical protein